MKLNEITDFLKSKIEPLENSLYGNGYRVAAYLTDGTYLPCVMFRKSSSIVNLAIKRFKEETTGKSIFSRSPGLGYYEIVKTFVATGNCINHYDIAKVEISKYAFPINTIKQIKGETKMGWTGFVGRMNDNTFHAFGTDWHVAFFDMPAGYHANDIVEIINHSYIGKDGELKSYNTPDVYTLFSKDMVFHSKPFFECFVDNI